MRSLEAAILATLRQIQRFLDDYASMLGALNRSRARRRLDQTAAQMAAYAVDQMAGRRTSEGETARQRRLRLVLRHDHMQPIALIARQYLREKPEFTALRLPPWELSDPSRLTAAALDMANVAEKNTELFVDEGLAPDFVAALRAVADELDASINARGQSRGQQAGATKGLKAETTRARALIRQFDSLVRTKLGTNDELLREWEVASHVKHERTSASATPTSKPSLVAMPTADATVGVA